MSSPSNSLDPAESGAPPSATIACNRCRKTKLRCSRDRPACLHCAKARYDCVYEPRRSKPGVKTGAIESIHQRLDKLERDALIRDSATCAQPQTPDSNCSGRLHGAAESVLALLAKELPKLTSTLRGNGNSEVQQSAKRRRTGSRSVNEDLTERYDCPPPLPSAEELEMMVDIYFTHIHPWVPMLHQDRFRRNLLDPNLSAKLQIVLQAIKLAAGRYMPDVEASAASFHSDWSASRIRMWIISKALERITLEGLQALILVAYDDIGCGNAPQAFSLVASLSRTVEFAQLTTEYNESQRQPICRPVSCLATARDWVEQEERRRVFWNVFLLDRFCSITMGWNTSLTSIDVHQRLPCDGMLWRKQEAVLTPYLGIWDKGTGGVRNSTRSFHRPEQSSSLDADFWAPVTASYSSSRSTELDMSMVGAFGYCVEATESMSRVTSYFLQQPVNPNDSADFNSWLARFKELDLRLVHWKMSLPHKWKSNEPPTTQGPRMDPNLTLAHVTHNTSTILLHQVIAYPPSHWPFRKRLPVNWSTETCCSAGVEIATITRKYLESTPGSLPIASFFAFCVYMAARMMIVHWRYDFDNKLTDEFWVLTRSLQEMSRRWNGVTKSSGTAMEGIDLAGRFSERLENLYKRCLEDEGYKVCVSDYTQNLDLSGPAGLPSEYPQIHAQESGMRPSGMTSDGVPLSDMTIEGIGPYSTTLSASGVTSRGQASLRSQESLEQDRIGEIPLTMDDCFMNLERVIAFDDGGFFTGELENGVW